MPRLEKLADGGKRTVHAIVTTAPVDAAGRSASLLAKVLTEPPDAEAARAAAPHRPAQAPPLLTCGPPGVTEHLFGIMGGVEPLQGSSSGRASPGSRPEPVFERSELDEHSWVDIAREWLLGADTLLEQLVDDGAVAPVPAEHVRRDRRRAPPVEVVPPRRSACPTRCSRQVRTALERRATTCCVGSYGLNYYRNGRDSVAWHRDTELRHLDRTLVAIVTLGAARPFLVRPRRRRPVARHAPRRRATCW